MKIFVYNMKKSTLLKAINETSFNEKLWHIPGCVCVTLSVLFDSLRPRQL